MVKSTSTAPAVAEIHFEESKGLLLSSQSCYAPHSPLANRDWGRGGLGTILFPSCMGNSLGANRCFWSATGTVRSMQVPSPFIRCKQCVVAVQALETKPMEALQNRTQVHPLHPLVAHMDIDC